MFPEIRHTFKVVVDTFNRNHYYELKENPGVRVVGGAAADLHLVLRQRPKQGEKLELLVRVVESWGNPAEEFDGAVRIVPNVDQAGIPEKIKFSVGDGGVRRVSGVSFSGAGPYRLRLEEENGLTRLGPPVLPRDKEEGYFLYWGDIHGQRRSTVGTGTVEEYFQFARDKAGLGFAAWQGNDFRVRIEYWEEVKRECETFNEPGRFVMFLGYEWSGTRSGGGDYNIYFSSDDAQIHRSSHAVIEDLSDVDTDRYPILELWETFRGRKDVMPVAYVGGRCCNLDFFDPEFVHPVEAHSHHGTFEWILEESLARGFQVGVTGASDDHTGRLGLVYPNRRSNNVATFDVKGGLMGIYAKDLTRESIWEAMRAWRTYGTNGERIFVKTSCDGHWMGEEISVCDIPRSTWKSMEQLPSWTWD